MFLYAAEKWTTTEAMESKIRSIHLISLALTHSHTHIKHSHQTFLFIVFFQLDELAYQPIRAHRLVSPCSWLISIAGPKLNVELSSPNPGIPRRVRQILVTVTIIKLTIAQLYVTD